MATDLVKCVFFIQDGRFGISEAHYFNATTIATAIEPAKLLFKKRMQLCGPPARPFRVRLGLTRQRRAVRILTGRDMVEVGAPTRTNMAGPGGNAGPNTSDQPKASIIVNLTSSDTDSTRMYLAGVPDPCIVEDPEGPAVDLLPAYKALFDDWKGLLISAAWGYVGRKAAVGVLLPQTVVAFRTRVLDGLLGVTVANGGPAYVQTQKVQLRGFVMQNKAFLSPNGIHQVNDLATNDPVAGQTTYFLRGTAGVNAANIKDPGTVEAIDFEFKKYTAIDFDKQTTRKRGNRFLAGPGRRTKSNKISS